MEILAQQGKGPPPMVMERFQSVASQLMNQVRVIIFSLSPVSSFPASKQPNLLVVRRC